MIITTANRLLFNHNADVDTELNTKIMRYLAFFLLFAVGAVQAATRYVTDELAITLRTGQGETYKILQMVKSGTPLEVLEVSENYTRVRSPKGIEGWVNNQYLLNQPVARDRIAAIERKMETLRNENQSLKQRLGELDGERTELRKTGSEVEKENQRLQAELDKLREIAAQPLQLSNDNRAMKQRIQTLEAEAKSLTDLNETLRNDSYQRWFLIGAGVLGGGILLGLILPKLRRKKNGWGGDF